MYIEVNDVIAIEQAGETFIRAINTGDISALTDFFAPKATVLAPSRPAVEGANVISFLRNMALQNTGLKLLSADMQPLGADAVRDTGTLSMRPKQQNDRITYKYLILWQKIGSTWKLSSMMWNRAPQNRRAETAADDGGM